MTNGQWDHDRTISNEVKIDHISKTVDRIESKIDNMPVACINRHARIDEKLEKRVSYKALSIIITVMGMCGGAIFAIIKWSGSILAAVKM